MSSTSPDCADEIEPEVNGERLLRRLSDFAEIGKTKAGGINRQALSSEDRRRDACSPISRPHAVSRSFRMQSPTCSCAVRAAMRRGRRC